MELSSRAGTAEGEELTRITACVKMVEAIGSKTLTGLQGVYTFIWAKTGQLLSRATEAIRLSTTGINSRLSSSDLTVTLKRPATKEEFYERLHYFSWIVSSLGMVAFSIIMGFVKEVVFDNQRRLGANCTWSVAHELMLLYIDLIEKDTTGVLNFANVIRHGMFDTLLVQARANEVICFRTRGGEPRAVSPTNKIQWNGKFNASSSQPCMAYNKGTAHTSGSLDADGTCRFNHICMQWVSDKGPRGICGGKHSKSECTYDAKLKLDRPLPARQ